MTKLQVDQDIALNGQVVSPGISNQGMQSVTVQIVCSIEDTQLASMS